MQIEMKVSGLIMDPITNMPIVLLKSPETDQILPIWVGLFEANAIALKKENVATPRPMTHDLLKNIMEMVEVKVNKIEVCDLRDNTYYALIHITHNGKEIDIDARPSDALALSLRMNAPIFVDEEVIEKSQQIELKAEPDDKSKEGKKWQEILENLNPEDFGKYKM